MTPKESLKAIRVSHAFASWPTNATTGQVLRALTDLYDKAFQDGAGGRVEEGRKAFKELMEVRNG